MYKSNSATDLQLYKYILNVVGTLSLMLSAMRVFFVVV